MTDLRKAAEQALEALDDIHSGNLTPMAEESWNKAKEALRQALAQDALKTVADIEHSLGLFIDSPNVDETAKGVHEALAWLWKNIDGHQVLTDDPDYADGTWTPLYTAPPKREWVGLTDEEIHEMTSHTSLIRYFEAKLKEKNT